MPVEPTPRSRRVPDASSPSGGGPPTKHKDDVQEVLKDLKAIINEQQGALKAQLKGIAARLERCVPKSISPAAVMGRLDEIAGLLKGPKPNLQPSWAAIAGASPPGAQRPLTAPTQRHIVRVQLQGEQSSKAPADVLQAVRKAIPAAVAIRSLRSGDVDVTVPSEAAKDKARTAPPVEGIKIYRKDYLVEVPGVPLSLQVNCGKGASNSALERTIMEASRVMTPGVQLTSITWKHKLRKTPTRKDRAIKTRGSLIIGVPTQDMQRKIVAGGLIIDSQLFEARLFDRALMATQCFNCQQWGHSQGVCGRRARCGGCAGDHQTRDCGEGGRSCVNCGKRHAAWNKGECRVYGAYLSGLEAKSASLAAQSIAMRGGVQAREVALMAPPPQTINPKKRPRANTPTREEGPRRVGRPTYLEQANRDRSQQRLNVDSLTAPSSRASQESSSPSIQVTPNTETSMSL